MLVKCPGCSTFIPVTAQACPECVIYLMYSKRINDEEKEETSEDGSIDLTLESDGESYDSDEINQDASSISGSRSRSSYSLDLSEYEESTSDDEILPTCSKKLKFTNN